MIKSPLYLLLIMVLLAGCSGDKAARLKMGDPAPDFLIEDLTGKSYRLSDFKDRPVIIRFFITDCKFCKADTPVFNDYYERHRQQGLAIFYLTTTVDRSKVAKFAADLQIPFPVAIDYNKTVTGLYNVKAEPQTIILNSEHLIKGAILGGVTEPEFDEILGGEWQK
ncbi:MAG: redoxin domain-containing protein [Thermodesulfobacteriota bacterium]